jgi:subtilisin family serine protease
MVEAEVPISDLSEIAARPDVEMVYAVPRITAITPVETSPAPAQTTSVQPNLTYIHAQDAWAAGYTGKGRLVCSFDTGVDGSSPYIHDNWKGLDGDSAAAWFDPSKNLPYPDSISNCGYSSCNTSHGTHVMGIMVGHSSTDTIGVAPDAKWISAAVIDLAGTSIVDAFEWAADPDGDPNTIGDMPDVINNSWGIIDVGCENLFFNLIDNIEALGIVTIFAAGNEGTQGTSTIRNPAVRALDSLDCFAVGNVNNSGVLNGSSSRGPSTCPGGAVKPNVVAPGTTIISSVPGGGTASMTGTSMAAPHVSGLVALLREKNPNATVDQIKTAILTTTNNLGHALPDNDYGWGLVNCIAALNALPADNPSTPDLRVYRFDHQPISPGDTATGYIWLKNAGTTATSVTATLAGGNAALSIIDGASSFGTIAQYDTAQSATMYRVAVSDTVTVGSVLSLDLQISGSGYNTTMPLYFSVVPSPERTFMTISSGHIQFSVSDYGTYGFAGADAAASFYPLNGVGFNFTNLGNDMYEGGFMIGYDGSGNQSVSDGIRNDAGEPDGDFGVLPGGTIGTVSPIGGASQQTHAAFDDSRAEEPIGLSVTQNTYAFDTDPNQDFVLLQYYLRNDTNVTLNNLYVGVYTDWDIITYPSDVGGYDATGQFNWMSYSSGGNLSRFRGVKIVQGGTYTAFTQRGALVVYPTSGDGFTEAEKLQSLESGFIYADSFKTTTNDYLQITAARIATMAPGQVDTVAFAFLAGNTLADMQVAAVYAQTAYDGILTDVDDGPGNDLPDAFALHQNYPNPFNPTTTIGFSLPRASNYTLSIYNIVGQLVHEVKGFSKAGDVEIEWDADKLASGIYLYKVTAGRSSASKKMLLLK